MNYPSLLGVAAIAATLFVVAPSSAQIKRFGGDGERKSTSNYYWDTKTNKLAGGYCITYGSPPWKKEHEAEVTSDKDGALRLGSDDWATLDTFVPLTISGVKIPAGQWYLGLRRQGGKFSLMILRAERIRSQRVAPWMTHTVRAKIHAPLTHSKVEASEDNLLVTTKHSEAKPTTGTLSVRWGNHELKAPILVDLSGGVKASDAASRKKNK